MKRVAVYFRDKEELVGSDSWLPVDGRWTLWRCVDFVKDNYHSSFVKHNKGATHFRLGVMNDNRLSNVSYITNLIKL